MKSQESPKWLLLVMVLVAQPAIAGDGLDVRDWLSRPGVKLLAVEFYASWCGPCKKAVPQWKALHEKYRDQGLRLVVVSVQDPDGACVNPGWNPDDVVCDTEGRLAEAWGVGDRLPAAFLWSWRGPLLIRKGHVGEVKRAVEEELRRLPRVTLDEGMDGEVRDLLRSELARTGKVDVMAGREEEKALAAIRRTSHELQFSNRSACLIGERLAANSLLKASFVRAGNGKRLLVQLFSAETGCLNASAGVFWNVKQPELSVAEAMDELVNNLRVVAEMPGSGVPRGSNEEKVVIENGESRPIEGSEIETKLADSQTFDAGWMLHRAQGHSNGTVLWPSVSALAGFAVVLPSKETYVGPVGWSVGAEAMFNVGQTFAVGLRYMYTAYNSNEYSAGRSEASNHIFTQYLYDESAMHEVHLLSELAFVKTTHVRWSALAGLGVGFTQIQMEQFIAPDQDGNGIPESKPEPRQTLNRADTGPAFLLGTALEYFPVDYISLGLSLEMSYLYTPVFRLNEGAMGLRSFFSVEGHF